MIKVNIHDAKTHLSEYLAKLKNNEVIVICKRNIPIAEMHLIPAQSKVPRPIGLAKEAFEIPASFFDPLPENIIKKFYEE